MHATQENTSSEASYVNLSSLIKEQRFRIDPRSAVRVMLGAGDHVDFDLFDETQAVVVIAISQDQVYSGQLLASVDDHELSCFSSSSQENLLRHPDRLADNVTAQFSEWGVRENHCDHAMNLTMHTATCLRANAPLTLIAVAVGEKMQIDSHTPPAEVAFTVHYAEPKKDVLPEPLADVKYELRIPRASARSYEVQAGEWIQIIDVSGKQCSDFLAFDREALEHGKEIGLDATATRSVLGLSNPVPGLHSRFLGPDLKSMIQIVQDTVGRHDSFLLACTPKYYEDSGFFGHASCSENFNYTLADYGIAPRDGWPAINLFFNTAIEPCGTVFMDEPWSRAGDYVLMRADRDLVCASSACPDDIDPANGWVPTEIHVRVYAAEHEFPPAIAHRLTAEEQARMTKTSGFHTRAAKMTTKFEEYGGYWVVSEYAGYGATAEYYACRDRVAMLDLTALQKLEIIGPDAAVFLHYVLTQNIHRMAIGEVAHSAVCLETGGMIDDGTLFKMGDHAFRWFCGDTRTAQWFREKAQEKNVRVSIRNSTDQINNLAVQGPRSRDLLSEIIWTPESQPALAQLSWFHFTIGKLQDADGPMVMISRTGYTGELGFEVWCHPDHSEAVWDAVWEAGQAHGIAPMGFEALDMLRIEAGLSLSGYEFDHTITPFEAGTGFSVPLESKPEAFIGRAALVRQAPESRHRLMGLVLDGQDAAASGDAIYAGRFPVGIVTSACFSPLMGKQIALIRVAPEYAVIDSELEVGKLDGMKKRLPGRVTSLPFYDPTRARLLS